MRRLLVTAALGGVLLCGCDRPSGSAGRASIGGELRAEVNPHSPYAGEWAESASNCGDDKKTWTIEPHRMGIEAARFCAFKSIYVSEAEDTKDAVWSAAADCLADGHESREFVFFRVKPNLREMRVTFNDNRPVELVRCASHS
ncbi:MAG: hypothetical protein GC155_00020 [Alphaproteobacteria bacterium]|nr:hypothetical protein [Alphaproteobacteria bacterium]